MKFGTTISPEITLRLKSSTLASVASEMRPLLYWSIAASTPPSLRPYCLLAPPLKVPSLTDFTMSKASTSTRFIIEVSTVPGTM